MCVVLAAIAALTEWLSAVPAGASAWVAGALLWADVPRKSRIQGSVLFLVGASGILVGLRHGHAPQWGQALGGNAYLIAMLAAVSFLRLITKPGGGATHTGSNGTRGLMATLAGVHLFGAVVNLSTVFIMAYRMSHDHRLSQPQYVALVRGFGAAAFWSPFFAAMAAALTYAPGAKLGLLLLFGIPLALVALLLTFRDVQRMPVHTFQGYPMDLSNLWLPGALALLILLTHAWQPDLSILGLITLFAPLVTGLALAFRRRGVISVMVGHIYAGLPAMKAELVLFLAAGVMAVGITVAVQASDLVLPISRFGATEAGMLVLALVVLSIFGVHPIIGVAAAAPLLSSANPDPSLLASSFLAAWAIGVPVSPLSAMNLGLQGSYGLRSVDILKWNLPFSLTMIAVATLLFQLHPAA